MPGKKQINERETIRRERERATERDRDCARTWRTNENHTHTIEI